MNDRSRAEAQAAPDVDLPDFAIGELARRAAARWADMEALIEIREDGALGRRWTHRSFLHDVESLAAGLASRFAPGERIVIYAPNEPEWPLLQQACALAGLIVAPANPAYQKDELLYVLNHAGAAGLFASRAHRGNPMAQIAAAAAAEAPALRETVILDDRAALDARGARDAALPTLSPDDPAMIHYVAGDGGYLKGAVLSHRGLIANARFFAARAGAGEGGVWLNVMPMFHTAGCGLMALGCLDGGRTMALAALFEPETLLDRMEGLGVGLFLGVPTMVQTMLAAQERKKRDLEKLAVIACGGAAAPPGLASAAETAFSCAYLTIYGQTEYSPVIAQTGPEDEAADREATVGRPIAHTALRIRRPADGATAALGETGEICARGPCAMLRYHDDPEASAAKFDEEGYLRTGDLGAMDARGFVRIEGRLGDMIIRGGENFFPKEIERVIAEHDDVAAVAVVGLPDRQWGEIIAAFIAPRGGAFDEAALCAHCRARMAPQKTPSLWRTVETLPRGPGGAVDKAALIASWREERA